MSYIMYILMTLLRITQDFIKCFKYILYFYIFFTTAVSLIILISEATETFISNINPTLSKLHIKQVVCIHSNLSSKFYVPIATLTIDFLIFVLPIFNGTYIQCSSVWENHTTWILRKQKERGVL